MFTAGASFGINSSLIILSLFSTCAVCMICLIIDWMIFVCTDAVTWQAFSLSEILSLNSINRLLIQELQQNKPSYVQIVKISINKEEKCDVLINNAGVMKCRKMHTQVCWCSHAWCIRIENVDQNLILFHHWCMFVTICGLCMSLDGIDTTLPKLLLSPFAWSGRHRAPTWHQPHGALSSFSFA